MSAFTRCQVLKILKQQIDAELPECEESLEIVDVARSFLVDREFRLINMRKNAIESNVVLGGSGPGGPRLSNGGGGTGSSITSSLSQTTPMQLTPSSSYDPFKRNDTKRKSITNSFSSIFRRPGSSGELFRFLCFSFLFASPFSSHTTKYIRKSFVFSHLKKSNNFALSF